jgi:glycosyltransferase involved in cell wall biosynthesis
VSRAVRARNPPPFAHPCLHGDQRLSATNKIATDHLKILFFSDHFYPEPSAPAAHVFERAALWVKWGHSVTVVTAAPNFPEGKVYSGYRNAWRQCEEIEGIRVVRVKTYITRNEGFFRRTLDYVSYMVSSFLFAFGEPVPDVVISTSPHLFAAVGGLLHAKVRRRPHVFELRDLWPASVAVNTGVSYGLIYRTLENLELALYRGSRRVLAFTESYRRDLIRRGIPAEKIDVVINGANLALFAPARDRDAEIIREYDLEGCFVVGYLGTLGLSHGLTNVLDAADLLRGTRVRFLFVGVGAAKADLESEKARRGLDNVIFVPRQPREQIARFWSVCDASLVHLKNDPVFSTVIPSKIFESMAMGLPVLYCGPPSDGSEIVIRHDAGMFVSAADPTALAAAIARIEGDPELRRRQAANSAAAAFSYSRERQAELSLDVLRKAVEGAA